MDLKDISMDYRRGSTFGLLDGTSIQLLAASSKFSSMETKRGHNYSATLFVFSASQDAIGQDARQSFHPRRLHASLA
ncbi:MAG: hypothetical protein JW818_22590 [Pirellulales bacterium]|nr:hypothetical protein [Pirellulales bacterium]